MTEKTISIESLEFTNFEKTLIISNGKIRTRTSRIYVPYDKTVRGPSQPDVSEVEYKKLVLTEAEKQQYQRAVPRGENTPKYKFQGKLISGGMGAILEVIDQDLHRPTAMKVIKPSFKNEERALIDFIREAKITAMLEHPNIIPVHELGLSDETGLFFTMKLMKGEPLNHILNEIKKGNAAYQEKYNEYSLLNIFRKICDAVDFAHSKHIIHRDIKPHNVIVGHYGEVLLMDWGLALYIGDPEKEEDPSQKDALKDILKLTDKGKNTIQGSPAYLSPEQAEGNSLQLDKKTDIFLLAATFYHILTLESPYTGENLKDVLQKAKQRDLIHPQQRNPERHIPAELCRIVMKASSLKKEDRYDSVQGLIKDIDDVIAGHWLKQEKKIFTSGQFLMKEGEEADEAYLIDKGKVQVYRQTDGNYKVILGTLEDGDIVGEMALITDDKRSASVEALEDTEVSVLTKDILSRNLKKLPPYIEKMMSTLTRRLQIANIVIHPHLVMDCTPFVLQQMCLILKDISSDKKEFALSHDKLSLRISEDLGLPVAKVKEVLKNAAEANLFTIRGNEIVVEDIYRLLHSVDLAKSLIDR
jgi:eukaryotic-like serine/threonine-protein kinase